MQVILLQNNAQLRVLAAQLENAGTYTCVVAGLGERSATLTVRGQKVYCSCVFASAFSVSAYTCISSITFLPPSLPPSPSSPSPTVSPVMTASLLPRTEVSYDSPLTLTCSATGIDISWQWYHNGTLMEDTTGMNEQGIKIIVPSYTIQRCKKKVMLYTWLSYLQPRKRRQQVTGGKRHTPCNVIRLQLEEVG